MTERDIADRYERDLRSRGAGAAYYGHSDFYNYGYWTPETRSQREASEDLVGELLKLIPYRTGTILDVACGAGATTRHLLRHYEPEAITGIDISPALLELAAQNAPGCTLIRMNAADMHGLPDESFENVLCVEAAFHFDTREDYLREALRVLKPGGRLVQSDILFDESAALLVDRLVQVPRRNFVSGPDAYRCMLEDVGFEEVAVRDATRECWQGFRDHLARWRELPRPERPRVRDRMRMHFYTALYARIIAFYVLCSARKPGSAPRP